MSDQGEKIVFLAREILEAGAQPASFNRRTTRVTMSFKTLCLTTFLAAAGGGLVTNFTHENARPLNRYEKTEIQALVFYAAKVKGLDEAVLRRDLEEKMGVSSLDELMAGEFPEVRRFLQERAL
jgi:hypothetical protein